MPTVDRTGAPVEVADAPARGAFEIAFAGGEVNENGGVDHDGTIAGRAHYFDRGDERVFFHTVVDEEFGGRGLATILIHDALEATLKANSTVVPVCPMVARYLDKNGEAYEAEGGRYREPTDDDLAEVRARQKRTDDD